MVDSKASSRLRFELSLILGNIGIDRLVPRGTRCCSCAYRCYRLYYNVHLTVIAETFADQTATILSTSRRPDWKGEASRSWSQRSWKGRASRLVFGFATSSWARLQVSRLIRLAGYHLPNDLTDKRKICEQGSASGILKRTRSHTSFALFCSFAAVYFDDFAESNSRLRAVGKENPRTKAIIGKDYEWSYSRSGMKRSASGRRWIALELLLTVVFVCRHRRLRSSPRREEGPQQAAWSSTNHHGQAYLADVLRGCLGQGYPAAP